MQYFIHLAKLVVNHWLLVLNDGFLIISVFSAVFHSNIFLVYLSVCYGKGCKARYITAPFINLPQSHVYCHKRKFDWFDTILTNSYGQLLTTL